MGQKNIKKLMLPPNAKSGGNPVTIETRGPVVIVGANGSGKTRFGTWIEFNVPQECKAHRISAQKSLAFPESSSPIAIDKAENLLFFGYEKGTKEHLRGHRWSGKPDTILLNDFDKLMVVLFSDFTDVTAKYYYESQKNEKKIETPSSKIHTLQKIWENLLPHRKLVVGGSKVEVRTEEDSSVSYNGSEMSDGERVIFYQIGQALCAPKDATIIIDEPELHLHKAILARLWDTLEQEREDCLFVYLTHDLDFAVSRENSLKVALRKYDKNSWDWDQIPDSKGIPEELFLSIIGSRKPILFIEGEKNSTDYFIYSQVYTDFTVEPLGSCRKIIDATRSFNSLSEFHNLKAFGIIDRDHRTAEEIKKLNEDNIFTLQFAEIENVFLIEEIIKLTAEQLCLNEEDSKKAVAEIKKFVLDELQQNIEDHSIKVTVRKMAKRLSHFNPQAKDKSSLKNEMANFFESLNSDKIYDISKQEAEHIIKSLSYNEAISVYNNKGLVKQVGRFLNAKYYDEMVKAILTSSKKGPEVLKALKPHLPQINPK